MAMAKRASVTVSIAALTSGTARVMPRVNRVDVSTASGNTSDAEGTSSTSSKVSPSAANLASSEGNETPAGDCVEAMAHDTARHAGR